MVGFQFVRKGVESVREGDREITLSQGSIAALWDGLQPTDIEILEPFHKRTLLFPRERVRAVCPRLGELTGCSPSLEHSGPARLLVRYMNALAAELPQLGAAAAVSAANVALELLRAARRAGAAVRPRRPSGPRCAPRSAATCASHLQDSDLGPTTIARAFAMSVRALHALFEDGDESVAVIVRNERLQRCLEDLQHRNAGSVTDIAFRWGFCETAHFSRVFKRRFGVTPSEVRHMAQLGTRWGHPGRGGRRAGLVLRPAVDQPDRLALAAVAGIPARPRAR